ncbi:protein phosphatase 2C domain-containing protein [Actinomadura sp. 7K534]|uniref:PP2C family protein-serine/threonine phosphatase n=1 Tax=Actinomadura sp. 7K534 TaxID=2530366 RepID=UPI00104C903B|nr:protein phosphatase 2C domain-containing protein [Actinomadura sp. 7K534]TDB94640.1 serine/threonine-protein phosphatase [Actinomadura sp. 7K534]
MTHHVLRFDAGTDVGVRRKVNEDSAYAGPRLLAVADGMGGHPHGDVASRTAITTLAGIPFTADPAADLASGVAAISDRLDDLGRDDPGMARMGTTLTAMAWDGHGFTIAHIGDSRAYLLRAGELHRLTRDHTMVQSLVEEGRLTEGEAAGHPRRSKLVRALQSGAGAEADLFRHDAQPGDRYLLCSDGVFGFVEPEEIRETLVRAASPAEAVARLIELATLAGGHDNATCVVADVVAPSREVSREPLMIGAAREPGLLARLTGLGRLTRRPATAAGAAAR